MTDRNERDALVARLRGEADRKECVPTRTPTLSPASRWLHPAELRTLLAQAAEALAAPAEGDGAVDPPDWPECSGNPGSCPENEGYGCCKPNSEAVEDEPPCGFIKVRDAIRGVVAVSKVFPGDVIAEEYETRPAATAVVPDGWTITKAALCDGYCIDSHHTSPPTSTLIEKGNNLYPLFAMLAAAPAAPTEALPAKIWQKLPVREDAHKAVGDALGNATKAVRVLLAMLKTSLPNSQGIEVADQILADLGYAEKMNTALANQEQRS